MDESVPQLPHGGLPRGKEDLGPDLQEQEGMEGMCRATWWGAWSVRR
jgi:hypothetical protein